MIEGSCLCGRVRFRLAVRPQFINHCHCSLCRKASGAGFGTFVHADGRQFAWLSGEGAIQAYESSPGNFRPFCRVCGSRVPVLEDEGREVIIPAGTLDTDPALRPIVHFHVASKAPWSVLADGLPQFAGVPPQSFWDAALPPSAAQTDSDEGRL